MIFLWSKGHNFYSQIAHTSAEALMAKKARRMSFKIYQGCLNETDFNLAVSQTRITERNIDAARQIMVHGKTVVEMADELGTTRVAVTTLCRKILEKTQQKDWVLLNVQVPKELRAQLLSIINQAIEDYSEGETS